MRANRVGQSQTQASASEEQESEPDPQEAIRAAWSPDRRVAEDLVAAMIQAWQAPILTLSRAGRAFEGLEGLLGGFFDLQVRTHSSPAIQRDPPPPPPPPIPPSSLPECSPLMERKG